MRKKVFFYLLVPFVIAGLLGAVYFVDRVIRCKENGLTYNNAFKVANEKLKVDFNNHSSFELKDKEFDSSDKHWRFIYTSGDCSVSIIVDNCGVSDIGGFSKGCIALLK